MRNRLPTLLTLSRIVVIPFFLAAFLLEPAAGAWVSFGLFAAASVTDWLDGWLARRWGVGLDGSYLPWRWDTSLQPVPSVLPLALLAACSLGLGASYELEIFRRARNDFAAARVRWRIE